jgi:hypothetical protein
VVRLTFTHEELGLTCADGRSLRISCPSVRFKCYREIKIGFEACEYIDRNVRASEKLNECDGPKTQRRGE